MEKEITSKKKIIQYDPDTWKDPKQPKQLLQEFLQKDKKPIPTYEVVNQGLKNFFLNNL